MTPTMVEVTGIQPASPGCEPSILAIELYPHINLQQDDFDLRPTDIALPLRAFATFVPSLAVTNKATSPYRPWHNPLGTTLATLGPL